MSDHRSVPILTSLVVMVAALAPTPAALAASAAEAPKSTFTVHMSSTGDDAGDGTHAEPVRSLPRVKEILTAEGSPGTATILIRPGTYFESTPIAWDGIPQQHLVFRPADPNRPPVFDGTRAVGNSHYWMNTRRGPSLDVRLMVVRHYRTGGIRLDTDGNLIRDVVFERLGNRHVPDGPGYSALHLLGSSNNTFTGNVFRNLENDDCAGCMHAVYAANGSSDSRIAQNWIADVTGDAVRLRHDTHRNVVTLNTFLRSGEQVQTDYRAMVSFWRFTTGEVCGSENRVDRNVYDGRYYNGNPGQQMVGSGASDGVELCPDAVIGTGNILRP